MIKNLKLAAISKDGTPVKETIENISDIKSNIEEYSLSWLECVVDDVKTGSSVSTIIISPSCLIL